jgi:GWxTD domain-containing protein
MMFSTHTRFGRRLIVTVLAISSVASLAAQTQLASRYKKWLDEEVRWIITPEERANFVDLSTDEQRDKFIVDFWEKRNPTPGAPDNKFKQEHYRRLAYANMHFALNDFKTGKAAPGWKTDRGRIYILHGPPDSIDNHAGGGYQLANGVKAATDPYEVWYYKSIKGIGQNVSVRFVDHCRCGDFHQSGEMEQGQAPPDPGQ